MRVVDDSFHRVKADGNNQVELAVGTKPVVDSLCDICGNSLAHRVYGKMMEKAFDVALVMNYHHRLTTEMVSEIPNGISAHVHSAPTPSS